MRYPGYWLLSLGEPRWKKVKGERRMLKFCMSMSLPNPISFKTFFPILSKALSLIARRRRIRACPVYLQRIGNVMDLPLSRFNILLPLLESLIWTASARYISFCGVFNFMALDSWIRKTSHRIRPLRIRPLPLSLPVSQVLAVSSTVFSRADIIRAVLGSSHSFPDTL